MKTRLLPIAVGVLCLFLFASCSDDDPYRPSETEEPDPKEGVFEGLVHVWENMDIDRYPKLLDDGFIFYFSQADYADGKTPKQWGRTEELASASNIFSNVPHAKYGSITSIDLVITPDSNWIEVPKTEPPYEGETWYQKKVEYDITMDTTSGWTLQGVGRKALITVRLAEVDVLMIYRIVQWHDDIE